MSISRTQVNKKRLFPDFLKDDDANCGTPAAHIKHQYFDIMGSRGIYHKGWMASTFGPKKPWVADVFDLSTWDPMQDKWELFDTRKDYSLMHDLSSENPKRLEEMKTLFMQVVSACMRWTVNCATNTALFC